MLGNGYTEGIIFSRKSCRELTDMDTPLKGRDELTTQGHYISARGMSTVQDTQSVSVLKGVSTVKPMNLGEDRKRPQVLQERARVPLYLWFFFSLVSKNYNLQTRMPEKYHARAWS